MRSRPATPIVAALLLACATTVFEPPYQQFEGKFIDHVDPQPVDEKLFGGRREARSLSGEPHRESTLDTFGGFSLIEAPEVKGVLEELLARIVRHYPHATPEFEIFATSRREYGAYATPYNDIFVSLGTLEQIESEDEMAFILGHEAAHALLGHFQREEFLTIEGQVETAALGASVVATSLARSDLRKGAGGTHRLVVTDAKSVQSDVAIATLSYFAVQELSGSVFAPMWKRHQEDEADLLAMDLMVRAGYAASGSMSTLERIGQIEEDKALRKKLALERQRATYGSLLLDSASKGGLEGLVNTGSRLATGEGLRMANERREDLQREHRLAVERREDMTAYYKREYLRERQVAHVSAGAVGIRERLWSGRSGEILRHHVAAHEALAALEEGRLEDAEALGRRSISGPTRRAPFPRFAMYQIRRAQGRLDHALKNLEIARTAPNVPGSVLLSLAEEYMVHQRPKDTLDVIREAGERFGTTEPFLPIEVAAHGALRDEARMLEALDRCSLTEKKSLIRRCEARVPEEMRPEQEDPTEQLRKLFGGS